jgi:integrase/recombinase XerD
MSARSPRVPQIFEQLVLDFLTDLEQERGLARNTVDAYRSDLVQFGAFLADRGREALAVEPAELDAFADELATSRAGTTPLAPATLQRKIACLRSFYRHLRDRGMIERNPASELSSPRLATRRPQPLSRQDIQRLLAQPRGTSPAALRDRALLELLYACAIRVSEAIALQPNDLDLATAMLRADADGPKERLVPVPDSALAAIRAYLEQGRPLLLRPRKQPRLFVNQHGNGLTRQGIYKIVQHHARTAGLAERITTHAPPRLRDTPARQRRRATVPTNDAGPHQHRHHPAVHRRSARRRLTGDRLNETRQTGADADRRPHVPGVARTSCSASTGVRPVGTELSEHTVLKPSRARARLATSW